MSWLLKIIESLIVSVVGIIIMCVFMAETILNIGDDDD